jgi:hypothetical protein
VKLSGGSQRASTNAVSHVGPGRPVVDAVDDHADEPAEPIASELRGHAGNHVRRRCLRLIAFAVLRYT